MARTNLIGCNKKEVVVELTQCTARFFQLIAMKAHYKLVAGFAPPRLPRLNHHLLNTVVGKQTVLQSVGLLQQKVVIIALQQQAIASHAVVSGIAERSEEHTSELQSRPHLVCRLLLEKKK